MAAPVSERVSILATLEGNLQSGLERLPALFRKIVPSVTGLSGVLGPLAASASAVVAALGAATGLRASIAAAKEEVDAEARLLQALNGREEAFKRVRKATVDLQAVTTTSDNVYVDYAATLANVGVKADDLDEALSAVANTVTALGVAPSAVIRAIGAARSGGLGRSGLGTIIPELQDVIDSGGTALEVIRALENRFRGAAAAVAATAFGQFDQQINLLSNDAARLGKVLIDVKVLAITALRTEFAALVDTIQSAEIQGLVDVLKSITPEATKIAVTLAQIGTIAAGLKLASFLLPALAASIPLAGALGAIAAAIGLVQLGSVEAGATFDGMNERIEEGGLRLGLLRDEFASLLREIGQGKLPVSAFFDRIKLQFENVVDFVKSLFVEEFKALVRAAPEIFGGLFDVLLALFGKLGNAIEGLLFSGINSAIAKVRAEFPKLAKFVGINEGSALTPDAGRAAASQKLLDDSFANLSNSLEGVSRQAKAGLGPVLDRIAARNAEFEASLDRQRNAIASNTTEQRKALTTEEQKVEQLRLQTEFILAQAEDIAAGRVGQEGTLQALEAQLEVQNALVEGERAAVLAALGRRADLLEREEIEGSSLALLKEQKEVEGDLVEASKALLDAEKQRAQTLADANKLAREQFERDQKAAESILQQAKDAQEAFRNAVETAGNRRDSGQIGRGDELGIQEAALGRFQTQLQGSRDALEGMKAELDPLEFLRLRDALDLIAESARTATGSEGLGGFFEGIGQGVSAAAAEFDSLSKVGQVVGGQLASGLSEGLVDVFIRGRESFRAFLAELLAGLGATIAKVALLKLIEAGTGGIGSAASSIAAAFASGGGQVLPGFAGGGPVPGVDTGRDSVLAALRPREFVEPVASVDYYGRGVLEAMRQRLIPRELFAGMNLPAGVRTVRPRSGYAAGGDVSPSIGSLAGGPQRSFIVADEQAFDRLVRGGNSALLRAQDRNRETNRAINARG